MTQCPFCDRDPFHYVDNGIGMEAVAVTCCENGDLFYRGQRPPLDGEVTMDADDFRAIGAKINDLRWQIERRDRLIGKMLSHRSKRRSRHVL